MKRFSRGGDEGLITSAAEQTVGWFDEIIRRMEQRRRELGLVEKVNLFQLNLWLLYVSKSRLSHL